VKACLNYMGVLPGSGRLYAKAQAVKAACALCPHKVRAAKHKGCTLYMHFLQACQHLAAHCLLLQAMRPQHAVVNAR